MVTDVKFELDPEDQDLAEQYNVALHEGFENIIVVDNVPKVPEEKEERLLGVLRKLFKTMGNIKEDGLYLPRASDPENPGKTLTKGFCFIEFESPEEALAAVKAADGYRLDKQHVFAVTLFQDIERYSNLPTEFKAPEPEPYVEREHLRAWLTDASARDQFVTRYADETAINWNMKSEEPEVAYNRANWTDTYVQWSPKGTYLTTIHRQGIALWGGPSWKKVVRFSHQGVRVIDFSPNEKYMCSWSQDPVPATDGGDQENLIVWDLRSGKKLRGFLSTPAVSSTGEKAQFVWPILKWSHDDKYVARQGENAISVYETPSMQMLENKSIKIEEVKDFSWSPSENTISYWTPESGNNPARVTLLEIPSKNIKRTKNLFNVSDCKMHWQSDGDFLAVKVERKTKTKKSTFNNFEFFRMRDKEIPVEVLELKDPVIAFSWEPKGERFALIHGENQTSTNVSFYTMDATKAVKTVRLLKTLERKTVNHLYWSPKGQFIVLAGLKAMNGQLEFWNVQDLEQMAAGEHFMCTDIEWDPTGRYVATFVSSWRQQQMENGFNIWDFRGKLLYRRQQDKFYQFIWRPRPATLLSKDKQKEIRKNLKKYSADFDRVDEFKDSKAYRLVMERRRRIMDEWLAYRRQKGIEVVEERGERRSLRGYASDDESEMQTVEEWVEEVIDEKKVFLDQK